MPVGLDRNPRLHAMIRCAAINKSQGVLHACTVLRSARAAMTVAVNVCAEHEPVTL
jgi:hypothetical protein